MLQKETFMNDFQSHANLTSMFDVYNKAFKRRLAFGTLKLFLLESLWIEHSSMVKMRRAARAAVGSGREVAKMREGILAGRNRDCCCVIWFNDSKALRHFFLVTTSRIRDKKKLPSGRRRNIASWSRKRQDLRAPDGNWGHKSLPFVFLAWEVLFLRPYNIQLSCLQKNLSKPWLVEFFAKIVSIYLSFLFRIHKNKEFWVPSIRSYKRIM